MIIDLKQINNAQLINAIAIYSSGGIFSGNLASYIAGSGSFGPNILYTSGGNQTVIGPITFSSPIEVSYTGDTGAATPYLLVFNMIQSGITTNYNQIVGNTVSLSGNDIIQGSKTFTGNVSILQLPNSYFHSVNLGFLTGVSGVLANSVGAGNTVLLTTNQLISGIKSFVSIPNSLGVPVNPSDLVVKSYVDNATANIVGAVTTSGLNQVLSGGYQFTNSILVPIATNPNAPATLAQLQALGVVLSAPTGFAGVLSINGSSGASGSVFLQSAGTVSVIQCGPIFYISGISPNGLTQLYSAKLPVASGTTGLQFIYNSGFNSAPVVIGNLEVTGNSTVGFALDTIYNVTTGGFAVAFSTGIPGNNYLFDFAVLPIISGSGFYGLQGAQGLVGPSINSRGIWQVGQMYNNLDVVYNPPYNASFLCYNPNISSSLNSPGGTGNSNWSIFSSGAMGASGIWNAYYNFSTGQIFAFGNTTFFNGSSYGYTGLTPTSGIPPTGAGWVTLASQGAIGYFINSGTITGNFVNMSFFLNPVNTGLNLAEAFVSRTFNVTGYALGCTSSGTGLSIAGFPGPLSGDLYYRDLSNNKTIFQNFTFNSGIFSSVSGNLAITVTGMYRIGIDLTNTLGGLANFSIGVFGFGTM